MNFEPIGHIRSPYTDKFGIPRQPGLVSAAEARLELLPPFAREEAFKALDGFSHVWILFVFHQDCPTAGWNPTVRPPRLGGRESVGVFASRAPYRPNPIGISAVEQLGLVRDRRGLALRLRGVDMLDGTPVLDIKPYVPYADAIPEARAGFASPPESVFLSVSFTETASAELDAFDPDGARGLRDLITQVLTQDPRPGYMDRYPRRREFGLRLHELNIRWSLEGTGVMVTGIQASRSADDGRAIET
ncbi:tRNA (N6-threonylcarbamoyladenosine(37)-N6)-methyltransferase TrmO [Thiocystis violacea]|uniref:tRNA (N6-threonylcarbamoyladenosine(37)-N6)-methyltransferase TrmO n=1 Tax=Thiocystis violacea TaxID=13725 RepID=UPI001906A0F5|nr:tRNA (N6-threonylcarbamoyladenosine(37)-N6)-methyltransferase TrmO [Thiocystis violacea]MBK1718545.1 tRNA (N6-threonylcarbamoyladenosine(37)-N6)-methyltransferase TrmO [Thiocystis violacea]